MSGARAPAAASDDDVIAAGGAAARSGDGPLIAIVDYGMGNRRSVEKALEHVTARATISRNHDLLRRADGLLVPGVGAFPRAMRNLAELGLDELIAERVAAGTPTLGICLGMQVLFESSSEHEGAAGLGLLAGRVEPLAAKSLKLPHIGWNVVRWRRRTELDAGLPGECAFYHVHSFAARPDDDADVLGVAEYGEPFASAVARGSLYGVQFHPEKSSTHGLRVLANFAGVCARRAARA